MIRLDPPLRNDYRSHSTSRSGCGKYPTQSGQLNRVVERPKRNAEAPPLEITAEQATRLEAAYA